MVTRIFLVGLRAYVWANILTLSSLRDCLDRKTNTSNWYQTSETTKSQQTLDEGPCKFCLSLILFNDAWSQERHSAPLRHHTLSTRNHQIRYQATHKVGNQPGDRKWPLQSS